MRAARASLGGTSEAGQELSGENITPQSMPAECSSVSVQRQRGVDEEVREKWTCVFLALKFALWLTEAAQEAKPPQPEG